MAQIKSEHVITSLQRQLSDAHLKIAMLEAQLIQMGEAQPAPEPVLVVPTDDQTGRGVD